MIPILYISPFTSYSLFLTLCFYPYFLLHLHFSSIYTASGVTACINVYGLAMQPLKAISLLDTMTKRGVPVNVVQVTLLFRYLLCPILFCFLKLCSFFAISCFFYSICYLLLSFCNCLISLRLCTTFTIF